MRVLIVDDEAPARERLSSLLADSDQHEVVGEAGNGQQALEIAGQRSPRRVVALNVCLRAYCNDDWGRVDSHLAPSNVAIANVTIVGSQYVYAPISGAQVSPETIAPLPQIARLPSVYRIQFGVKFRF